MRAKVKIKAGYGFVVLMWLFAAGWAAPAFGAEVVLNAITAWPESITDNAGFFDLQERVNDRGEGIVQIRYLGGPEIVPNTEQIEALRVGVVDVVWGSAAYMDSIVPAANFLKLSEYTPEEERENGLYELVDEVFRDKANAHYLGRGIPSVPFHIYTVERVETLDDFRGIPVRATANYRDFFLALGASPVTMPPGDAYTALQYGVIEGFGWPAFGITDWGWEEVIGYRVDPGFYQVDTIGVINLDTWNRLSPEAQQIVTDAAIEMEQAMQAYFADLVSREEETLKRAGVEIIRLPGTLSESYRSLAYDATMPILMEAAPEYGPRFRELLGR